MCFILHGLYSHSHSRMDLVPFYARLVATLHPCLDDIVPALVDMLMRDFRFQVRKKDQVHIHSKLKNVRFIGKRVCVCVCMCVCVWVCVCACSLVPRPSSPLLQVIKNWNQGRPGNMQFSNQRLCVSGNKFVQQKYSQKQCGGGRMRLYVCVSASSPSS